MTKKEPIMTLTEKLSPAEGAGGRADIAKDQAILISAISLPGADKGLNLISGIFLKTFLPDKGVGRPPAGGRKEARISRWI